MMKLQVLALMIFMPVLGMTQATDHFADMNSKWYVARSFPFGSPQYPSFVGVTTTIYGFQGDSLIGNDTWLKLYSSDNSLFNNLVFEGLIKSSGDSVFYIDTVGQQHLLYDFSLNAGDSVLFDFAGYGAEKLGVTHTDTILVNGQNHKRLFFSEPTGPTAFEIVEEVWVEGIGSVHGPLYPDRPEMFSTEFPDSLVLTCTVVQGQQYWHNSFYTNCFVVKTWVGLDENPDLTFEILPNPFTDFLKVRSGQPGEVSVMDVSGRTVFSTMISAGEFTIDLSRISAGLYDIQLKTGNRISSRKIVKQ